MQDGHTTKTQGRVTQCGCAWLGRGWGKEQQLSMDTSLGWGLVLCFQLCPL